MVLPSRMIVMLVRDLLDLVELVADDDARDALGLQPDDQVEQVLRVVLVQGRGGLVEDEQLDVLVQRLRDLHELLLADADVLDLRVRVVTQADAGEQVLGTQLRGGPVDGAEAAGLVAEEQVLGDRELRDQRELLVDDHDAGLLGLLDVREADFLALEDDLAGVGAVRVDAGEDLHQGRLAGTVLAADRVDLAGTDVERDLRECLHTRELLGDRPHLEDGLGCGDRPGLESGVDRG